MSRKIELVIDGYKNRLVNLSVNQAIFVTCCNCVMQLNLICYMRGDYNAKEIYTERKN